MIVFWVQSVLFVKVSRYLSRTFQPPSQYCGNEFKLVCGAFKKFENIQWQHIFPEAVPGYLLSTEDIEGNLTLILSNPLLLWSF